MEIKHLQTFRAILEEGSFLAAADTLGYTQSSVTQHIRQLEESLGIKLFDKLGRKMVLSEAGRKILPYVDELLQTADKITNIDKTESELTGELRIACFESLLAYRLTEVIERFSALAPNVKLIVYAYNSEMIRSSVLTGKCDLGLFFCEDSYLQSFQYEKLSKYPIVLTASTKRDTASINPDIKNSVIDVPFVTSEPDGMYRRVFQKLLYKNNVQTANILELWSITAIKKCVMKDIGITYLPLYCISEEIQEGALKIIPCSCNENYLQTVYICNKNKWMNKQTELFIELLKQADV